MVPGDVETRLAPPWLRAAAVGAGVWVVAAFLLDLDRIEALLALAPLVLVPLGLALVAPVGPEALRPAWRALPTVGTVAAVLLTGGLVLRPGWWSLALTLPWLACTVLVAAGGIVRAIPDIRNLVGDDRQRMRLGALVTDAGLVFLPVGAGWTALSAVGARPLRFAEPIVLLTGVHFHYSGFVMAVLAGWLAQQRGDPASTLAAIGVVAGVPLVAAGIVAGGVAGLLVLELAAAAVLGGVGIALGTLQAQTALAGPPRGGPSTPVARGLLGVSGACLVLGMVLAIVYPLGRFLGSPWVDIPTMAATHGVLNAVGFGLLGLLAWTLSNRREAVSAEA